ncbi:MAG TPA: amidohydrolase family protein, partial [Stellaceae bacterium]
PALKIVGHHMGGMIPYFSGKIKLGFRQIFFGTPESNPAAADAKLKKPPVEYYKMLYADTALGEVAPTRCGHAFFGTDHCLFATDAPFDAEQGKALIGGTVEAVGAIETAAGDLARIRAENARALLRLP